MPPSGSMALFFLIRTTPSSRRGHAAIGSIMLFTGLRFNLSPGVGGADASRPVDGGPLAARIAALFAQN